jgi:phage terminase large subunit-like protein
MTEEGRRKVESQYSLLASIEGADSQEWVCGTRYHPKDLYSKLLNMKEEIFNDDGEIVDEEPIFEIFERQVEDAGDGTGQFLWPRQQRSDGKFFGFDTKILAKKRGQYLDRTQFRAQYYNDPNDPGELRIDRSKFQYYDKKWLTFDGSSWFYKDRKLNVFASADFAYSIEKRADYTAIAVIGMDSEHSVYILEIDRFKTNKISEIFEHVLALHTKWDFRRLGCEITSGQKMIVQELKDSYIRPYGLMLSVVEIKHTRHQGSKEERIAAALEPRYDNHAVWHYKGGNCEILEEELMMEHPPHDDCMDALASVLEIAVPPSGRSSRDRNGRSANIVTHERFGGIRFA